MTDGVPRIEAAHCVLPCADLDATLAFFTDRLGFRVDVVMPADAPSMAVISGHGLKIALQRGAEGSPGVLRLLTRGAVDRADRELVAPNGTRIEFVQADPPLVVPPHRPSFVLTRAADSGWGVGRAGMQYRDLLPGRQGGRFVASHIRIPRGGPVPDYVHYHKVRFQVLYCYRGDVRVVYEDQGPPLVMRQGDCVLQPPQIRHRVLECSPGLEVIEIGCPAEHETRVDHDLALPTGRHRPERDFSGQRFVHDVAAASSRPVPWRLPGFAARDTGIAAATGGLAGVRIVRPVGSPPAHVCSVDAELLFVFVLRGTVSLHGAGRGPESLGAGDCFAVPAGMQHGLAACSADLELLEVSLPAVFQTVVRA